MIQLMLIRHGESVWNQENRFTGWQDVELSPKGRAEAERASAVLKEAGCSFDLAYTSVLKRAIHTLDLILDRLDQSWLPVTKAWQLNERHYGALTGLNKAETAAKHGEEQVKIWRRSYSTPPPPMNQNDPRHPCHDRRYRDIAPELLPSGESLAMTVDRVVPYFRQEIEPKLRRGKKILIAAHGNSIRALLQSLEGLSDAAILELNIPTAIPIQLTLEQTGSEGALRATQRVFLGDPSEIEKAMAHVASQGKAKS